MEEIISHQLVFLRACYGHDDVHDNRGSPDGHVPPPQRHGRGQREVSLHYVPGETASAGPLHHEPDLVSLLYPCAGQLPASLWLINALSMFKFLAY